MKKILVMLFLVATMVFSGAVMATDCLQGLLDGYDDLGPDQLDGIEFTPNTGPQYVNLDLNRSYYGDENKTKDAIDQVVGVTLEAQAFIPCYIELRVTGNLGESFVQSFGPDSAGIFEHPQMMIFDNEVGGFVNENWESLGHGYTAEITPEDGRYIQACDIFKVDIWANDTYRYQVESHALMNVDADISSPLSADFLTLDMRTCLDNTGWGPTHTFTDDLSTFIVEIEDSRAACESLTALHQFRVPYNRTIAHGTYEGMVLFIAYTI